MIRCLVVLATFGLLGLTSCRDEERRWGGIVQDSAGIPMVLNGSVGLWGEEDRWVAVPELRFGQSDGPTELVFGEISGLAVGAEGEIIVLDRQAQELRVFDQDGRFLRRMARSGAGPGELSESVRQVLLVGNGILAVPDLGLQRVTLYSVDGSSAGSIPVDVSRGIPALWGVTSDLEIVYQATILQLGGSGERRNVVLALHRDGATQHRFDLPTGGQLSSAGGRRQFRMFASEPRWATGHDGDFIVGMSAEYRIELRDRAGKLIRVFSMPHEIRPISAGDQMMVRQSMADVLIAEGADQHSAMDAVSSMEFAEHFPAFTSITRGPNSTVWVQRVRTPDAARAEGDAFDVRAQGDRRWDVFDGAGRYLGVIELPRRFELMHMEERHVYGRAVGESGAPEVVRLRLEQPR